MDIGIMRMRKNNRYNLCGDITIRYTREELTSFIRERDAYQSRLSTAKELGISPYTLRRISAMLGLSLPTGRTAKEC